MADIFNRLLDSEYSTQADQGFAIAIVCHRIITLVAARVNLLLSEMATAQAENDDAMAILFHLLMTFVPARRKY
jgi:hypothetical protein